MEQPERLEQPTKIVGIVAEYNPFHGGYKFQIEEAKKWASANWCVAAMSGDFVQRGEPAVHSKYLRTRMAFSRGAGPVVELPSAFVIDSTEDSTACDMALLTELGIVEVLCFGNEGEGTSRIQKATSILAREDGDFPSLLSLGLRSGLSWPPTRNQALLAMADRGKNFPLRREEMDKLLDSPNNLLSIKYCKAILRQDSLLTPLTIRRQGQGYRDEGLGGEQASTSAIQRVLKAWELYVDTGLPPYTRPTPESRTCILPAIWPPCGQELSLETNDLSEILNSRLLSPRREGTDYTQYGDMPAEMARRLDSYPFQQVSWESQIGQPKTRQYTYTWISRAFLHMVLGLTAARMQSYKEADRAPCARILGFKKESRELLALVEQKTAIPLITKTADAPRILAGTVLDMLPQDIYAPHTRQVLLSKKLGKPIRNEHNQPICALE